MLWYETLEPMKPYAIAWGLTDSTPPSSIDRIAEGITSYGLVIQLWSTVNAKMKTQNFLLNTT